MANEQALQIAVKIVKMFEGCELVAYPDPESDLYKSLSANNLLRKWKKAEVVFADLPKDMQKLCGAPWTIGYGETQGVKCGDVWTQEEADSRLDARAEEFMAAVLKAAPKLSGEPAERLAACTSLSYNIGKGAFATSTVVKKIAEGNWHCAGDAILMWCHPDMLMKRRVVERDLFLSRGV